MFRMRRIGAVLIAALAAAGARAATPEAAAMEAFARVDGEKLSEIQAQARLSQLIAALDEAGLTRSATALLAGLAADESQGERVRMVARNGLIGRAVDHDGVAQSLLARLGVSGKLPPALAVRLARSHLELALQLSPPGEGSDFEGIEQAPALTPASAEPLDKDLASEMGARQQESGVTPKGAPAQQEPNRKALRELDTARALAAMVPAGDPAEGEAREVAGLAALAAGDADSAARDFVAISQMPVRSGDQIAAARRDEAFLMMARLAYQSGDDTRATALYEKVGRGAPEWLDALFEASWAHFRRGEDEKSLGNLLTLHAPFFQGRFFPESFVLKALVMYENCRYGDARRVLLDFERLYRPLHDGLAAAVDKLPTPQAAFEFLTRGGVELQQAQAREEIGRLEQELQPDVTAVTQLAQEIDSIDKRTPAFRGSRLAGRMAPLARQARLDLIDVTGRKLLARLGAERAELRELLAQSLRLAYEIAGREKEQAVSPEPGLAPQAHREPTHLEDDEVMWPFQGEYWRDELGSYRFQLGQRCRRARPALPQAEKTALVPARLGVSP
jgi:hypothetical protein